MSEGTSRADLREKVGELLAQHLTFAHGLGGLVSADAASATDSLASAYAALASADDVEPEA